MELQLFRKFYIKPHIVGEGEDTNGGAVSSVKSNVTFLQTPANKFISLKYEFSKKPLVWRANFERGKGKADIYSISLADKKLRARNEIIPLPEGIYVLPVSHCECVRS